MIGGVVGIAPDAPAAEAGQAFPWRVGFGAVEPDASTTAFCGTCGPPRLPIQWRSHGVGDAAIAVAVVAACPRLGAMSAEKQNPSPSPEPVPPAVVSRLSHYLRELLHVVGTGAETISSNELGGRLGFSDAQVRKDLAHFGHFGHPGVGYRCEELVDAIRKILGTDRRWPVLLVGAGNLGRALLGYKGFVEQGFELVAAVDDSQEKIGTTVDGITVEPFADVQKIVEREQIQLAVLAVPVGAAQAVADTLVAHGVVGIVNFAPVTLSLPEDVCLLGVDLAMQLEQVAFSVANRRRAE